MRSTEDLENSLSVGSKNRLKQYQTNLAVTRGKYQPERDEEVLKLLRQFAVNVDDFDQQVDYLYSLKDDDGIPFSRNLKVYSTTEEAMARFASEDYTSFRWNRNYRRSLKELKEEFSKLQLRPLVFNNDDDIKDALPKKDTHSGYTWIETGIKEKGAHMEGIYSKYQSEARKAIQEGSHKKPILIGFRTQASGEFEDDGTQTNHCKHKLRVVSMVDLYQIISELRFSKPIQDYLGRVSYYAGGKSEKTISGIITNYRMKFNRFLSIDYSSFDQTISSWLIEDAFSIVKSAFKMNSEEEKLFDVIVNDFIHKDFILSEGILHSDKGVPSGSMFTQIIDSIVNVLVIKTYFHHLGEDVGMITMGDDNAIFSNSDVSLEDLASYLQKNFGLIVKVDDKSSQGFCKTDDVKFLSRYWTWHGEWRHPYQLLSRLIFPERHRNYDDLIGPQHVIFAFMLTYGLGMEKLIKTGYFTYKYPISKTYVMNHVDSRYLPGAMAYIREYT
jgi:hypothetical protein